VSEPTGRSQPSPGEEPDEGFAEEPAEPRSIEALRDAGDVDGLLALAKAYRSGTEGPARDLAKCLACYRAAAALGSPEAEYAVALFLMSGGPVEQDWKEGATRLRAAAEKGHLGAKVYVANLYELGVHYAQDSAKADVWYRSAARGADVTAAPGTPEYARAMAELGCVRYVLALADDPATPAAQRDLYLRKARAAGYQLHLRQARARESSVPASSTPPPSTAASAPGRASTPAPAPTRAPSSAPALTSTPTSATSPSPKKTTEQVEAEAVKAVKRLAQDSRPPLSASLAAFGYSLLFAAAALGAGIAGKVGVAYLVAQGKAPPQLAEREWVVLPAVFVLVGVLPAFLPYRGGAVLRAVALGAVAAVAGWFVWATRPLLAARDVQALAFGAAAFLATLLVLGFFGGVKAPRRPARIKLRDDP